MVEGGSLLVNLQERLLRGCNLLLRSFENHRELPGSQIVVWKEGHQAGGTHDYKDWATCDEGEEGPTIIRQIISYCGKFIDNCTEYNKVASMTSVHTRYNEIGAYLTGNIGQGTLSKKEICTMKRVIQRF